MCVNAGKSTLEILMKGVAGDRRELSLSRRSILKSPWFWTVMGVVGVGAAITAAVVHERRADSGSGFSPGQVAAPLTF
jgi:hypothetical protein